MRERHDRAASSRGVRRSSAKFQTFQIARAAPVGGLVEKDRCNIRIDVLEEILRFSR
jgi:hypothetical protein